MGERSRLQQAVLEVRGEAPGEGARAVRGRLGDRRGAALAATAAIVGDVNLANVACSAPESAVT